MISTVVAMMSESALQGKTSLYVPGTLRMGKEIMECFEKHGLADYVVDAISSTQWRTNIASGLKSALGRQETSYDKSAVDGVRLRLEQTRSQLGEYTARLHKVRKPWNVSAWDALQALT